MWTSRIGDNVIEISARLRVRPSEGRWYPSERLHYRAQKHPNMRTRPLDWNDVLEANVSPLKAPTYTTIGADPMH